MKPIIIIILFIFNTVLLKAQQSQAIELFIRDTVITIRPFLKNENIIRLLRCKLFDKNIKIRVTVRKNVEENIILYYFNRNINHGFHDTIPYKKPIDFLNEYSATKYSGLDSDLYLNVNCGLTFRLEDSIGKLIRYHTFFGGHKNLSDKKFNKLFSNLEKKAKKIIEKNNLIRYVNKKIITENETKINVSLMYRKFNNNMRPLGTDIGGFRLAKGIYYLTFYYYFTKNLDGQYIGPTSLGATKIKPIDVVKKDIEKNSYTNEQVFQGFVKSNRVKLIVK